MHVAFATLPGGVRANEDWAGAAGGVVAVLDGISAADGNTRCRHGVPWYVHQLGVAFLTAASDADNSLSKALALAITHVAAQHPECDLSHGGTPSATIAALRITTSRVEYLVLSDAVLLLDFGDSLKVVTDSQVESVAAAERAETRRHAIGSAEHRQAVQELVQAQRKLRNQPGGYWVVAANPEAARHAVIGAVARSDVVQAALLTDGASRLVDAFGLATWREVMELLATAGPQALINKVRAVEDTDSDGQRWPRYKRSDDATAALVVVNGT
ncbi:hypothetical protein GCM10012275_63540 [Longimycelium tulufanense]|uniref:Uncharacterized protein n=1 Tax=Longimycelium tulufanense TaxID=907463 RepID=A0A8J3CLN8_9PSEU|nr:hypothetical protein [Longimycelium tulufanense]GGM84183.1 hypothetical protein GCM10012275_63540 [Longimycelium tulufanense]